MDNLQDLIRLHMGDEDRGALGLDVLETIYRDEEEEEQEYQFYGERP